jgi:peroxiredoxin
VPRSGGRGIIRFVDETTPVVDDPGVTSRPTGGHRRWLELAALLGVLTAALTGAVLWSGSREPMSRPARPDFDVARPATPGPAPEFALPTLDGRVVRLADFRGRVLLLTFWATWCEPCREEMPAMQELTRELAGRGLALLAVNYQEAPERVRSFVREIGLDAPVALDADGAVAQRYRVVALPATYVIDRTGGLTGSILGYRDWRQPAARAYVQALLGGAG